MKHYGNRVPMYACAIMYASRFHTLFRLFRMIGKGISCVLCVYVFTYMKWIHRHRRGVLRLLRL